jgi:membrane-bound metal-dependent hydrolase YbcI (DUF457 family)
MKLRTHIAFGLFFGILFYYFLGFGFDFVLLTGISAFIPDIDWAMQFEWEMGNKHRKFGHNIWFMFICAFTGYFIFNSVLLFFGIIIGFLSHLIADSFTVMGVWWLYPYGFDEKKFYHNYKYSMTGESQKGYETIFQGILFGIAGFMFLSRGISINLFSLEGIITVGVLVFVGYIVMKKIDVMLAKTIRNSGL